MPLLNGMKNGKHHSTLASVYTSRLITDDSIYFNVNTVNCINTKFASS